jgi:hypothetical protein
VSAAALLLVSSVILYCFSTGSVLNACAIAASSPKYGFCSSLTPSMIEKVFSLGFLYWGGILWTIPLYPTTSFRAKLLTAICIDPPVFVCFSGVSLVTVCTHSSYGASVKGLMVSSISILMFFSASTIWYSDK